MSEAITVAGLLEGADALKVEQVKLTERVGANRDMLRQLVTLGMASEEEAAKINELYPPRVVTEESKAKRAATRAAKSAAENAADRKAKGADAG